AAEIEACPAEGGGRGRRRRLQRHIGSESGRSDKRGQGNDCGEQLLHTSALSGGSPTTYHSTGQSARLWRPWVVVPFGVRPPLPNPLAPSPCRPFPKACPSRQ